MDRQRRRERTLRKLARTLSVIDVDDLPDMPSVETSPTIKREDETTHHGQAESTYSANGDGLRSPPQETFASFQSLPNLTDSSDKVDPPIQIKQEFPDNDWLRSLANTQETAIVIDNSDDDDDVEILPPLKEVQSTTGQTKATEDPMDIDPSTHDGSNPEAPAAPLSTVSATPNALKNSSSDMAPTAGRNLDMQAAGAALPPISRVTTSNFRNSLKAKQMEIAQKRLAAHKSQASRSQSVPLVDKTASSGDDFPQGGKDDCGVTGSYKDPIDTGEGDENTSPSDHESSAACGDNGGYESDGGLFVSDGENQPIEHQDGDIIMGFDETEKRHLQREDKQFCRLEKWYKKAKKDMEKKRKKGVEIALEKEMEFMTLEREYKIALGRRQRANQASGEDTDAEDESGTSIYTGHGGGDVADDALFLPCESRFGSGNTQTAGGIPSDEEEDVENEYEQAAKANMLNNKAQGGDNSGDELVGNRKFKPSSSRGHRRTPANSGKPRQSKKDKSGNDRIKDASAKVTKPKPKKGGKKPLPTLANSRLFNASSLFTGDVIRDAAGNIGLAGMPMLTSGRRADAMKQLLHSLPEDARRNASTDSRAILNAMKDFSRSRSVRTVSGGQFSVPGMRSELRAYQLLGAAFMRRRETDNIGPLGGICADQMGLGKTVMMLANIMDSLPLKRSERPRATLIVATTALVQQWNSEIKVHVKDEKKWKPKVMIYARSKMMVNDPVQAIEEHDIVLTTYEEVRKSYPKAEVPVECQTAEQKQTWWRNHYEAFRGDLHRVKFLRVVLDEAQQIKNHKSHTSIACRDLQATHRWALSGTPIQNSIQELYPYFKFLRVEYTGSYRVFCQNFVGTDKIPSKLGIDRLNQLLSRFMIRRTHADKVMGMPIIILPKAQEQIRWVKFNDVERSIYEIVRSRMIKRINKLSRSRQLEANYSHVLTMLLRLRQLTGHILTVEGAMRDLLEEEDHQKIYDLAMMELTDAKNSLRQEQLKRIRTILAQGAKDNRLHPGCAKFPGVRNKNKRHDSVGLKTISGADSNGETDNDVEIIDRNYVGGKHGLTYDFTKYLRTLRESNNMLEVQSRTICAVCGDVPTEGVVTDCYHVYCAGCLESMMQEAAVVDQDGTRCKECGVSFVKSTPLGENIDFGKAESARRSARGGNADDDSESDSEVEMGKAGRSRGGRKNKTSRAMDWIDQEGTDILPSAKTIEIKAQILNWIKEEPKGKIIIFTQFMDMIRILQKVCRAEGWAYALYHGSFSIQQRQENIKRFQNNTEIRILIASLKAGGIGLNLTMAQKVIIVDPWWNSSVEQQAFCRVFRIGQDSETSLTRFVVENTVDQNMIQMQIRKQEEIDQVMDRKKLTTSKLDVRDLIKLFGNSDGDELREDEDGYPFIFVRNAETRPNPLADDEDTGDEH